ncbi:MAG TPA: ABC transporter permease [Anaerolineales bacterium]|nr:ABC transporter permease [Anaerolineales bacterium]HMX20702.1 ABC transporter permease [Anaerolineales bacterium]HMZ41410.1 ABC transporter permease [Anaerolineales bacterium]HNA55673.1 ABC transporter permease [Anaerolineales bacterium]HNB85751.1 ABC transporter permease [Anaerolineales bacterium]
MNYANLFRYWRTVLTVAEMSIRTQFSDSFILFAIVFQPMIIAILALFMLREKGGDYAMFVVVGSGLTGLWSSLLFVSGNSINSERWTGTLESLVGVPTPFDVIVFGKNLANVFQSLLSMVTSYTLAAFLFGYSLSFTQPLLFMVTLLFSMFAFICFGLTIAPVFVMYRSVQQWQNAMEFPVYILGGFLFPIAMLPGWATPISYLLPPYWAAQALHGTSTAMMPFEQILFCWGMMIVFSVVDLVIASQLFKVMLYKARVDATLDVD